MKKITILTTALALLAFLTIPLGMWGQTSVTWPGTTALPGTATAVANDQNVTIMVSSTNTYTNPIRIYANTTVTINALNDAKILSVAYEASSTGNYVTNAQNATVTPNVTPTVSGKIVTWTYAESANVTEFTFKPSAQTRCNGITITYITPGTGPTVATPTFSPIGGTYTEAQTVSISCETQGTTIYYTLDGSAPDDESTQYTTPITVSETKTIKAIAYDSNDNTSNVASATYTIVTPMTIAEVRAQGTGDVTTTGTVTSCVGTTGYIQDASAAICVYGTSLTVGDNISVLGTLSNYNGLLEITNPQVTVISSGNTINPELMTIAQVVASTNQGWYIRIEDAIVTEISDKNVTIAQGDDNVVVRFANASDITFEVNDIISLNGNIGAYNGVQIANPQNVTVQENPNPYISAENVSIASDATSGNIEFTINNPVSGGVTSATTNDQWLTLGTVGSATVPFTCTANTATTARTATVVLTYTYSRVTVTKEVTVTQAAYEAPHVTWDLSIASYDEVTDPDLVTWSSNYATMTNATGTGGTSASNYLGGDANNRTSTRFYTNNVWTLSPVSGYAITSAVLTATSENYANAFVGSVWTNATASANGTTVTVTPTDGTTDIVATVGGTCGFTSVTVYYEVNNAPSISANNVEIAYDVTSGTITYTITNGVEGGALTASTSDEWITIGTVGNNVPFTCSANEAGTERTATVTLAYTYNRATVTKNVTVTQAGNPNATMTIAEVRTQGTGDVATIGTVTSFSINNSNKTTAYIQDATAAIVVFGEFTVAVGDEIRVLGTLDTYHGLLEITDPEVTVISQGNIVTPEVMTIAQVMASTNQGWYVRIEDATVTEINGQNTTIAQGENTIVVRGISGVEYAVNDVISLNGNIGCYDGNQIANPTNVEVQAVPSITITPDSFELDANSHLAEVLAPIAYHNIVVVPGSSTESFDVQYYDAEGHEIEQTWCSVGAAAQGDTGFNLIIAAGINEGNEARTAYFKLYGHDAEDNLVYSNLVTVTQAAPVIDYAVLPFEWEGGERSAFEALNGTSTHSVGDYAETQGIYRMKLDATGDYIQVKCDQQPGKVTIGVKMVGGSNTSTITIQGSADGETFTDIEVLTISGAQNDILTLETTNVFADADRYVRMLFTKGSNVGVGPITIAKGSAPSISVTPATLDLEATGTGQNGMQVQQFVVTYHNLDIESHSDFAVQFYDAEGEEQEQPTWITPNPAYVMGGNDEGYMMMLFIEGNTGVARSAYFKVSALDADENVVYSNLVTINQAGVAQQYTLTVEPFENLEIFTFFDDDLTEPMEGAGTMQVTEGVNVMLSVSAVEGYVMQSLMVDGVEHVNDIDAELTYTFVMPGHNVTISATAVEDVPFEPVAYTLATSIESGKTYIFVGKKTIDEMDNYYAMGEQKSNNRGGVAINVDGETAIVESDDVYEFVITALDADGFYSIYESRTPGYLYAAGPSNNYLRTESELDTNHNGEWEISIDDETGLFSIVASNSNNRNVMQFNYNNGNTLFSCYGSASQSPVYLYEKTEVVPETHTLDLTGYGTNEGRYYLIASPVSMIRPTADNGFLTEAYDLYYFDQAQEGEEWRNYKAKQFNIASGKGYLYASQANTSLTFTGMPYTGNGEITLDQVGWNLIGNPYSTIAAVDHDFYILNTNGSELELSEVLGVNPMQGIFVLAESENEVVLFDSGTAQGGGDEKMLNIRVSNENGISDFARIRFGEGKDLGKLMLNENHTKLYFPVDGKDYAVVYVNNESEMPVNFKAETDGTYTFSVKAENMEMQYLHLIDNQAGTDVDLLANPSYSFEASVNDSAARFTLVIRNK